MSLDATHFISSRSNKIALTQKRIKEVLWYFAECYTFLQNDNIKYSKKWCSTSTKYHFEDYLKMEFVDNYLIKNKSIIQNNLSALEQINFSYETIKRYEDSDGIEGSDKIDIYINKLGLQDIWKDNDEHIYLAVECKRINQLSDCNKYIDDIQKFCSRNYKQTRLPIEGMLAFLENPKITHENVSMDINSRLETNSMINTKQYLSRELINKSFEGSYLSSHLKNYNQNERLSIYHLLFDYSNNIVD